jgi:NAD+ kinase
VSTVLFQVHPVRPAAGDLAARARVWWEGHGYDVVDNPPDPRPAPGVYDFALSFGGDGTMLRTLRLALPGLTPVVGINLGRMGYLAEVEPAGMTAAFESLLAGDFKIEERMALDVAVNGPYPADAPNAETAGTRFVALNEAIVERSAPGHTITVAVDIAGRRFLTYVADGLLVCTPTGSTAYNLSARGPVVSPNLRALVLTAVAPHMVFDRSLVLGPEETVTVTLLDGAAASLVVDGSGIVSLVEGDVVVCSAAQIAARFVTFGERESHAVLRSRFSLSDE